MGNGGGDTQYAVLTRNRHDRQPPQVLPLDEAHSLAHIRLRRHGARYAGYGRIHDRGEFGQARIWVVEEAAFEPLRTLQQDV